MATWGKNMNKARVAEAARGVIQFESFCITLRSEHRIKESILRISIEYTMDLSVFPETL